MLKAVVNPKLEAEIKLQPQYWLTIERAARNVARHATRFAKQHGAPWMPYTAGDPIQVHVEGDDVYVLNTDYGAVLMEWGSINNPPFAPLRRGVRAAGLILKQNAGRQAT